MKKSKKISKKKNTKKKIMKGGNHTIRQNLAYCYKKDQLKEFIELYESIKLKIDKPDTYESIIYYLTGIIELPYEIKGKSALNSVVYYLLSDIKFLQYLINYKNKTIFYKMLNDVFEPYLNQKLIFSWYNYVHFNLNQLKTKELKEKYYENYEIMKSIDDLNNIDTKDESKEDDTSNEVERIDKRKKFWNEWIKKTRKYVKEYSKEISESTGLPKDLIGLIIQDIGATLFPKRIVDENVIFKK